MTSTLKNHRRSRTHTLILFALYAACVFVPAVASAQAVSLGVTPTLIEISAEPGSSWESTIKVINNNSFPLTVYAVVTNFVPEGEGGQAAFVPKNETDNDGSTIAEWLTVSAEPVSIERESSAEVPIKLTVPADATPGGHYAAIQIGTKPPEVGGDRIVRTSQFVTSLFFARVAGDVIESGNIRSFRPLQPLVGTPSASFELRFENKGNVHLQPQGEIVIRNMWGTLRGTIPVNQQTHFGNVLPASIRKFEFTWSGVFSLADIGRYTAEVTLAYGTDARQSVSSIASFYVVPLKALVFSLMVLLGAAFFIRFVIRSYVRRMLYLAGVDPDLGRGVLVPAGKLPGKDVRIVGRARVTAPVSAGYTDLRTRLAGVSGLLEKMRTLLTFVYLYKVFFLSLIAFIVLAAIVVIYIRTVTDRNVPYEVTIDKVGEDITISSEQILYDKEQQSPPVVSEAVIEESDEQEQEFKLVLTNASGRSGVAADLKSKLEGLGFTVDELNSDLSGVQERTVIVFDPAFEEVALALSAELNNALLSASTDAANAGSVTVFIGSEHVNE